MDGKRSSSYLPTRTTPPPPSPTRSPSPSKSFSRLLSKRSPFPSKLGNILFIIAAVANLILSFWVLFEHGNFPELFPGGEHSRIDSKKCHLPDLEPYSPEIRPFLKESERIDCTTVSNPDFQKQKFFKIDEEGRLVKIASPGIPCCYRPFFRVNDGEVFLEPTRDRRYVCHNLTETVTELPVEHEYIEIICDSGTKTFKDGFALVKRKDAVEKRIQEYRKNESEKDPYGFTKIEQLNVIILGIDSTSQMNFIRRMPKSEEFVRKLGGVRLDGYVKVGENMIANLVPLLTGMGLEAFKELCVNKYPSMEKAVHLDTCPFIWKEFKAKGYRTLHAEDDISQGIFHLYWSHAFQEVPTDHYYRPLALRMYQSQNIYDGFCFGPRMSFEAVLDYYKQAAKTYSRPFDLTFNFLWTSKLSHDDPNRLSWGDAALESTLKYLKEKGTLDKSVLFLLADHGARGQEIRASRQGQLEDRLPLAYVILPPSFEAKYPQAMKNLRGNAKLITSPYDIYETFKDFMDLGKLRDQHTHYIRERKLKVAEKKGYRQGTSLFSALPPTRSCTTAGIPPHWCICYKKKKVSVKSLDVHDALSFVLRHVNAQLLKHRHICEKLSLKKVTTALKWHSDEAVEDSWSGSNDEAYKKASLLQITFQSKPPAEFEVTVIFDPDQGWRFTEQVVRLDRYEERSKCMPKQELKKICICKDPERDPELMALPGGGHEDIIF